MVLGTKDVTKTSWVKFPTTGPGLPEMAMWREGLKTTGPLRLMSLMMERESQEMTRIWGVPGSGSGGRHPVLPYRWCRGPRISLLSGSWTQVQAVEGRPHGNTTTESPETKTVMTEFKMKLLQPTEPTAELEPWVPLTATRNSPCRKGRQGYRFLNSCSGCYFHQFCMWRSWWWGWNC